MNQFYLRMVIVLSFLAVPYLGRAQNPQTPQTPQAPEKMADIYYKASDYAKALPLYLLILKEPNLDENEMGRIAFHIGQCQTAQHQYAEAIKTFDDVTTRYGNTPWAAQALLRKGAVEVGLLNKPKEGLATWQLLIQRYGKTETAAEALYYSLAYCLVNKQRAQAQKYLHTLEEEHPASAFTTKAQSYLKVKP